MNMYWKSKSHSIISFQSSKRRAQFSPFSSAIFCVSLPLIKYRSRWSCCCCHRSHMSREFHRWSDTEPNEIYQLKTFHASARFCRFLAWPYIDICDTTTIGEWKEQKKIEYGKRRKATLGPRSVNGKRTQRNGSLLDTSWVGIRDNNAMFCNR